MSKKSKDICTEAKLQFSVYESLINGKKTFTKSFILLDKKKSTPNEWIIGSLQADHELGEHEMLMTVEVHQKNEKNFKFRLDSKSFTQKPIIRYDSLGTCHNNPYYNLRKRDRRVTTPHIQRYNEQGKCIAYKTPELADPKNIKAWEDLNISLAMFCKETKAECLDGNLLEAGRSSPTLPFGESYIAGPIDNLTFES